MTNTDIVFVARAAERTTEEGIGGSSPAGPPMDEKLRITLRIPNGLHHRLRVTAAEADLSMNAYIVKLIEDAVRIKVEDD